jgi:glycosyltransferase involved in cell wall biosynthesis
MANFTIVIPVYNQYELLRQCVESMFRYIKDTYHELIIIDDYSDPRGKLREYENYLDTLQKIRVIKSDEYRLSVHCDGRHLACAQGRSDKELNGVDLTKSTRGHGYCIQTGINEAKTDYVFFMDADSVFLNNSQELLNCLEKQFSRYPNCIGIGQLAGLMTNDIVAIDKQFSYIMGGITCNGGGSIGSPAFALKRLDKEGNLIKVLDRPKHKGWALSDFHREYFTKGYSVLNYPFFSQKKIFHIGGAILSYARFGGESGIENIKFGMLKDGQPYGGRRGTECMCDWYQGRYLLNMETNEYIHYLRDKYNTPFDQIQLPLDENLLYLTNEERPRRV